MILRREFVSNDGVVRQTNIRDSYTNLRLWRLDDARHHTSRRSVVSNHRGFPVAFSYKDRCAVLTASMRVCVRVFVLRVFVLRVFVL